MNTQVIKIKKSRFLVSDNSNQLLEPNSQLLEPNTELLEDIHFIPTPDINKVIINSFPNCEIISNQNSYNSGTSVSITIKINITNLLKVTNICVWKHNRPRDEKRCQEIANNIFESKYIMDTMLYFNYNNQSKHFEIIDGIHRYHSWKIIKENTVGLQNDTDSNWFYNSIVFINIRVNEKENDTIQLFKNINNSNPISELYIRNIDNDRRITIECIANDYNRKYSQHFSTSSKPHKPNINFDIFKDLLLNIYDNHTNYITYADSNGPTDQEKQSKRLEEILYTLNDNQKMEYNNPDSKKIVESVKNKCNGSGLWLFSINNIDMKTLAEITKTQKLSY